MKKIQLFIIIIICFVSAKAQNYTVSGYVKDAQTGEELLYSTVFVKELNKGFVTNSYGFYSITLRKGIYTLIYSYTGFETHTEELELDHDLELDVSIKNTDNEIEKVVITGEGGDKSVKSSEVSTVDLNVREAKLIPILFGEQDVLKTLQLLPGISASSEGSSGFYVRGGDSDQNLILLDEAPVYNASHLLGFFSVFNSDALNDIKMYKGGIPAQFGGRLSSVTDIRMKNGNAKKWKFSGGIGLISSRLLIEGPVKKDKSSLLVAGRRTYADIVAKSMKLVKIEDLKLYFYDLNLKYNYYFSRKNRLYLSVYGGRDVFGMQTFGFDWGNKTATLRWNHIFNNKLFMNTTAIYSDFNYGFQIKYAGNKIGFGAGIADYNLKQDYSWFVNSHNSVKFGWQLTYHNFKPMAFKILERNEKDTINVMKDTSMLSQYALESSVYLSNEQIIGSRLTLLYGIRLGLLNNIGPYETKTYNAQNEVISTQKHSKNEFFNNFLMFEPRINATFLLNASSSLKASYNRTVQNLHLLSNSGGGMPSDIWMPSSQNVKPEFGDQIALGFFKNIFDNLFEISVETFYRKLYNQVDFENGAQIYFNPDVEAEIVIGEGRAYGMEFLFRKKIGKLTGWLSYTLLKSEKKFDDINKGNWFSAKQDRTHDFAFVATYQISKKINLSLAWIYYTGNAVTFPNGKYYIDGILVNLYSDRNSDRMPDYHRLDLGLTWTLTDKQKFHSDLNFSIYNVYNRKNAYSITFKENEITKQTEAERFALFGIVPSVSWNFKF